MDINVMNRAVGRNAMTTEQIPQELIDILDERAGKQHSRSGSVVACLAEILTVYVKIKERRDG